MGQYNAAELSQLFESGRNVMDWLKEQEHAGTNTPTAILYSYDIQAGSYTTLAARPDIAALKARFAARVAPHIARFSPRSILDAGCGEATTLAPLLDAVGEKRPVDVLGFDISLSRLLFARENLPGKGAKLFTAELGRIPLPADAVDVVVTCHALEPNGGQEEALLAELLRVARLGLVLVEPSYERATPSGRARMERLGYVRGLPASLRRLGVVPVVDEPLGVDINPENPAALIVIEKAGAGPRGEGAAFASPISLKPLVRRTDCLFCEEDGHAFPIIDGIPCLTRDSAILVSKLGRRSAERQR